MDYRKLLARFPFVTFSLLLLVGCVTTPAVQSANTPSAPPSNTPPEVTLPPYPDDTPVPSDTPLPSPTQTPEPTSVPVDLVWFAPNMGSRDYIDLFTNEGDWVESRKQVDVFKFYTQNLLDDPCDICGVNVLGAFAAADAFRKLNDWGIATGIEVGAVKEWGCTGEAEFQTADTVIRNVQNNGGKVDFLAMDEPYIGGQLTAGGNTCGYDMEQSADATAFFVGQVRGNYPHIVLGDIEPYPFFTISQLKDWVTALEARGVAIEFFHLDVDIERVRVEGQNVAADLQELDGFFQDREVPFGVIFTSNWRHAGSDRAYFSSTMDWISKVVQAIGKPDHVIIQSWQGPDPDGIHSVPINLPEGDPEIYSHTRLILEGLKAIQP